MRRGLKRVGRGWPLIPTRLAWPGGPNAIGMRHNEEGYLRFQQGPARPGRGRATSGTRKSEDHHPAG